MGECEEILKEALTSLELMLGYLYEGEPEDMIVIEDTIKNIKNHLKRGSGCDG